MTVVAWDGKTLASDTMSMNGRLKEHGYKSKKIYDLGDGRYAGIAGEKDSTNRLVQWAKDGADLEKYPAVSSGDFQFMIIENGKARIYGCNGFSHEMPPPYVIGSGTEIALGAMLAGADARRAVEITCLYEPACGGEIDVLPTVLPPFHSPEGRAIREDVALSDTLLRAMGQTKTGWAWQYRPID